MRAKVVPADSEASSAPVGGPRRIGTSAIRLGLGCSRLGSTLSAGGVRAAEALVQEALESGIRLFDTADVYAQGDSERIIGRVIRRSGIADVVVSSKAGFLLPAPAWALRTVKPAIRLLASLRGGVREAMAERRAKGYPQDFTPARLSRTLESSLRRLRRDWLDVFFLHSPPPELAGREELLRFGEEQMRAGKILSFGVSCDGSAADLAWLDSGLVKIVQVPMGVGAAAECRFLAACRERGVTLIARELLKGIRGKNAEKIAGVMRRTFARPEVSAILIGTNNIDHLRDNLSAARSVLLLDRC